MIYNVPLRKKKSAHMQFLLQSGVLQDTTSVHSEICKMSLLHVLFKNMTKMQGP